MLKTKKDIARLVAIVLVLIATVVVIVIGVRKSEEKNVSKKSAVSDEVVTEEGLLTTTDTISFETIQDGLNEMGFLITEEYYFTEVITRERSVELLRTGINIPFTESSYVASYDGVVTAGIDFSQITVDSELVDGKTHFKIVVPKAEIQTIDIDPNSFKLYSEKTGIGNSFSVKDYNESLKGLESTVEKNAINKGLLERAEEHAKQLVESFVNSLPHNSEYTFEIVEK